MTDRYVERDTNPLPVAADQVAGRIAEAMSKSLQPGRIRNQQVRGTNPRASFFIFKAATPLPTARRCHPLR
jgi:hypothetical protein